MECFQTCILRQSSKLLGRYATAFTVIISVFSSLCWIRLSCLWRYQAKLPMGLSSLLIPTGTDPLRLQGPDDLGPEASVDQYL